MVNSQKHIDNNKGWLYIIDSTTNTYMEVMKMITYKNYKIVAKLQGAEINKAWVDSKPRNKYFVYVTNTEN